MRLLLAYLVVAVLTGSAGLQALPLACETFQYFPNDIPPKPLQLDMSEADQASAIQAGLLEFDALRDGFHAQFPNAKSGILKLIDAQDFGQQTYNCVTWSLGSKNGWNGGPSDDFAWWTAMHCVDFDFFDKKYGKQGYKRVQAAEFELAYDLAVPNKEPTLVKGLAGGTPIDEYAPYLREKDLVAVYATYVCKEKKWLNTVTHFARKGKHDALWSSKLGAGLLIGHGNLAQLDGPEYGHVIAIYAKDS